MEDSTEVKKIKAAMAKIREMNKAQAARARAKKRESGYKQVNIWMTDAEADAVKRLLSIARTKTGECRVFKSIGGKWTDTGIALNSPS